MDENTKQFYRDIRKLKDNFIQDVSDTAIGYGIELIPLSFDEIFTIWNPVMDKTIDKDFKRTIERKLKGLNKRLNPFWRKIRKFFGK